MRQEKKDINDKLKKRRYSVNVNGRHKWWKESAVSEENRDELPQGRES